MKIDRLYTLSQFVDIVGKTDDSHVNCYGNDDLFKEAKEKCVSMVVLIADKIIAYNNFLKQPLRKEMFVNKYGQPTHDSCPAEEYENAMYMYEQGENKIIFEGDWVFEEHACGKILLYLNGQIGLVLENGFNNITLEKVSVMTNGQLKLKNIEL